MESTAQPDREGITVEAATVYRWKPTNGTGVLKTDSGRYVWFHVGDLDGLAYRDVHEGLNVDVVIDETPQDKFECRAAHVRPSSQFSPH